MNATDRSKIIVTITIAITVSGIFVLNDLRYVPFLTANRPRRAKLILRNPHGQFHVDGGLARKSQCSEDVNYNLSGLKKIQDERKSRIRNVCEECRRNRTSMECSHVTMDKDYHSKIVYKNLLVNDKHKLVYCMIPKTGCTNWKKAIVRSYTGRVVKRHEVHNMELMEQNGLRSLSAYSREEIQERLQTYFKFLVVRHPFERLLSAFRSKFAQSTGVQPDFIQYLPYIRKHGKGKNGKVSFSNYVGYLSSVYNFSTSHFFKRFNITLSDSVFQIDWKSRKHIARKVNENHLLAKGSKYFDEHWAQYSTLCHPCHIDYDYIVKFETMREDAAYVLSKLGPHHQCLEKKYPELFNYSQSTSSVLGKYFSTLTAAQIELLKAIYSVDFKLFGYIRKMKEGNMTNVRHWF